MNDRQIDEVLARDPTPEVDPALLGRISASMGESLQPVRPLAPGWMIAVWLLLLSAAVPIAASSWIGMYGLAELSLPQVVAIFTALAIFTWFAALVSVAQMTPGGGFRWKNPTLMEPVMTNPTMLLLVVATAWVFLDALLFQDHDMAEFVEQGIPCLTTGLITAVPTGAASWMLLHRGFAVSPVSAGLAAGTLAGMAGLTLLELHCPNFRAPHIMVWHTAVVPFSAISGALAAGLFRRWAR